jgi:putative flippase GtrA
MQPFINQSKIHHKTILRWALVGFLTFVVDYAMFLVFYTKLENVLSSNFFAAIFSITFNYLFHFSWTFKSQSSHYDSSPKYLLNLFLFWILSTTLLSFFISAGVEAKIAKFIPITIIAPLSFLSLKYIVFKKKI